MAGITGISTTHNLPNYHGELIDLSPSETPFLSAAGGVGRGKQATSTAFEWQTQDLRAPESRPRLEGADAPTAESRVRANVSNVVQIFQESVATSYSKQAATGQYGTPGSAPFRSADGIPNPVTNEHAHQIMLALRTMATDVNYVMWHGKKVQPTDNSTARATGGLLEAITTNAVGTIVTGASTATDTVTSNSHGLSNGDRVAFTIIGAATGLRYDRVYYVSNVATNTFKVSATSGGSAITLGTATGLAWVKAATTLTVDVANSLIQSVFDNGGLSDLSAAIIYVPSTQKVKLSKAFADAYGKANPVVSNVGGVAVDAIATDFGTLNVAIDRNLPADALAVVSVEQVDPVFLEVPGKGVLFEEELAKTGSADKSQIYGEIGLAYGNEKSHGVIRGLAL
jgi:hypothetical protein